MRGNSALKKMINKKIFLLIWVIIVVMVIGVGYAYFSSTLYVNGTSKLTGNFDVKFDSATIQNKSELEDINIDSTGLNMSFSVKLAMPGEADVITYTIVNNGTIDAVLEELVVTSVADSDVTFDCSSIAGDLVSGGTKSGTITVTWNSDSVSAQKDVEFNAEIVARQKV